MFSSQAKRYHKKGFTLIELLVTITIVGVLASIGIPSFNGTIRSSRLTTNANQLIASLNYARSEAIKRNDRIYVRRKGATAQNWDSGWDVFIDSDADQIFNNADTLLKTYPALTNGYTLRTGANYDDWVAFLPTGLNASSGSLTNDTFRICATAGDLVNSRTVSVNRVGRARVASGNAATCP